MVEARVSPEDALTDEQELRQLRKLIEFVSRRSYEEIRSMETMFSHIRLPSGRILRGVQLTDVLWLGRDCKFYTTRRQQWAQAIELSLPEVLHFADPGDLIFAFEKAKYLARQRRARAAMQRASGE